MKIKALVSTLLAASVVFSASSCGDDPMKETAEDRKVVMTVSDGSGESEKVKYSEYRYFKLNNLRDLYGEGAELTAEQNKEISDRVEQNVLERHALRLLAEQYGITLTDDDMKRVNTYVDSYREQCGSDDAYREALRGQYITDPFFREMTADTTIAFALLDEMGTRGAIDVSDAAYERASSGDEMLCIKEIYISYPSPDLRDWAEKRAGEALSKLKTGESFEKLMTEYSSYNPEELPPEHGYYTMKYDALDEIWNTARSLGENEWSDVIETEFGFHIVMRSAKDRSYMTEHRDELYEIFRQSRFYDEFYRYLGTLTVEYTSFGAELKNMK